MFQDTQTLFFVLHHNSRWKTKGNQIGRLVCDGRRFYFVLFCFHKKPNLNFFSASPFPLGVYYPKKSLHLLSDLPFPALQSETFFSLPLGFYDLLHVLAMFKGFLASLHIFGSFSNTQGPMEMHGFMPHSKAPSPTKSPHPHVQTHNTCRTMLSQIM